MKNTIEIMSENVRNKASNSKMDPSISNMLDEIFSYYKEFFVVTGDQRIVIVYRLVAEKLSEEIHREKPWKWRYIMSVRNGRLISSPALDRAIERHWHSIHGEPMPLPAIPCSCGKVHTYDCGSEVVKKKPKPRGKPRPRRQFSISKTNIESAAKSIVNNYSFYELNELEKCIIEQRKEVNK